MTAERHHLKKFRIAVLALVNIAWIVSSTSCSLRNTGASGSAPAVLTLPASSIGTSIAVLNGTLPPGGSSTDVWFEYGTDPALSSWTATSRYASGSVPAPVHFKASIRDLDPYTTYYFRAVAEDRFGTRRGDIRSFPTGEYYVAVGDSITRADCNGGYVAMLRELLEKSRGYPITITKYGVNGATSAAGANSISYVLSLVPSAKYYLVMYGTNDARLPRPVPSGKGRKPRDPGYSGTYKESMQRILSAILAAGKIPVVAKVPYSTNPNFDIPTIREYNSVIDELVADYKIAATPPDFFDYFRIHQDEMPDGIHPNGAGYKSMAKLWFQALDK